VSTVAKTEQKEDVLL